MEEILANGVAKEGEEDIKISLNISGHRFVTKKETLLRYPDTRLGRLAADHQASHSDEYFFDADDGVFREVLSFYRTGELHTPSGPCRGTFERELKFWEIGSENISSCCQETGMTDEEITKQFLWFEKGIESDSDILSFRDHIWYFMTDPNGPKTKYTTASKVWTTLYIFIVIFKSGLASMLTSEHNMEKYNFNITDATFEKMIHYAMGDNACQAVRDMKAAAKVPRFQLQLSSEFLLILVLFFEISVRFICCPKKLQFFKSIHMVDLCISTMELSSCILLINTFQSVDNMSTDQCRNACLMQSIMHVIVQVRIYRVFVFAIVFR